MKKFALGLAATLFVAGAANAAAVITFDPAPAFSPTTGFTVIHTFNDLTGVTTDFGTVQIKTPPADNNGAPPANSSPAGTPYLSVLGGGQATINLPAGTRAFQFDWGSADTYNTLTVVSSEGSFVFVPGSVEFPNAGDGNQSAPGTNGLFTVVGDSTGETFLSITLASERNSFEIDNLATAVVPEPATWAMLVAGFGLVGFAMRRRRPLEQVSA